MTQGRFIIVHVADDLLAAGVINYTYEVYWQ